LICESDPVFETIPGGECRAQASPMLTNARFPPTSVRQRLRRRQRERGFVPHSTGGYTAGVAENRLARPARFSVTVVSDRRCQAANGACPQAVMLPQRDGVFNSVRCPGGSDLPTGAVVSLCRLPLPLCSQCFLQTSHPLPGVSGLAQVVDPDGGKVSHVFRRCRATCAPGASAPGRRLHAGRADGDCSHD